MLEKGLFFIPTPNNVNNDELRRDYHRRLKLLHHFQYTTEQVREPFLESSRWEPEWDTIPADLKELIQQDGLALERTRELTNNRNNNITNNLSSRERGALKDLKNNKDLVIKPADKGSKIVILDRTQYLIEANRQLSNSAHYQPLSASMQQETQKMVRKIFSELYEKKYISAKQKRYLFGSDEPRPRKFYLLPKIHKDPDTWTVPHKVPSGRPIVSDCGSESCRAAEFVDFYLNPLSQKHPSYVKDTYEFVQIIKTTSMPPGALLFSIDIDSLYTNINTQLGLQSV